MNPVKCPKCGKIYAQTYNLKTNEQFIKEQTYTGGGGLAGKS
mgnify:CR=1 FL=1